MDLVYRLIFHKGLRLSPADARALSLEEAVRLNAVLDKIDQETAEEAERLKKKQR